MRFAVIELSKTIHLQQAIEAAWAEGARSFELKGVYRPNINSYTLLKIGKSLSGIVIDGVGAILDGGDITSHVVVIEDAQATIQGLTIKGGSTDNPSYVARDYRGASFRSIYEAIDGGGLLILGHSDVKLKDCVIKDNHAGMCGGGISNQGVGLVEVESCIFEDNSAYHTGPAIDNLTPGSKVAIHRSKFRNNLGNVGSLWGGPHGQITIFDKTEAVIEGCDFLGKTFAIDAVPDATMQDSKNTYNNQPVSTIHPGGGGTLGNKLHHILRIANFQLKLSRHGIYPWLRRTGLS